MMTYDEAAARLHIKVNSVRQRVVRKKWRTIKGNDGTVRIEVPKDELDRIEAKPPKQPDAPRTPTDSEKIAALTATVEGLEKLIEAERRASELERYRANFLQERSMEVAKERNEWKARAEKLEARRWWSWK